MAVVISWTKEWSASDDGTIFSGADLQNIQSDIEGHGHSGIATKFINLTDTPADYVGKGEYLVRVKPTTEDQVEFTTAVTIEALTVTSTVNFTGAEITGLITIPSGLISLWSGAVSAIPSGWVICDGNNSTPNLTDRFIIHADADGGGTNDVGDTGGASTVSLSVTHLPAHTHGSIGAHTHTVGTGDGATTGASEDVSSATTGITTGSAGGHTHTSVGSGTAHSNRDKYYALAYIMKT